MRHPIPVLALLASIAMPACTAEPMSSGTAPSPTVTVTTEETMTATTSTDTHPAHESRIPLLDREAPTNVETATFALG